MGDRSIHYKCQICKCSLEAWEGHSIDVAQYPLNRGHHLPNDVMPPASGVKKYCDDCWEKRRDEINPTDLG